jgi:F420H(2)-dependent quinone reductase
MPPKIIFRTLNRIHIFLYRISGGRILGKIVGSPVLLLTTTGRKSGQRRTVPVVYTPDGDDYVVIASDDPAWYRNLKSAPKASVEVKKQIVPILARDASTDEIEYLWKRFVEQSPAFESFQEKPNHQLVVLKSDH